MKSRIPVVGVVVFLLAVAGVARAESVDGKLLAGGKPVAGATVTLSGVSMQVMRCRSPERDCRNPPPSAPPIAQPITAVSDADGNFSFAGPKGNYRIEVEAKGFRKKTRFFDLSGSSKIVSIKLKAARKRAA